MTALEAATPGTLRWILLTCTDLRTLDFSNWLHRSWNNKGVGLRMSAVMGGVSRIYISEYYPENMPTNQVIFDMKVRMSQSSVATISTPRDM